MDHSRGRRVAAWALAVLMLMLFSGCRGAATFHVVVPDFDSAAVSGLWLWRGNGTGGFARHTRFTFRGTAVHDGVEVLTYTIRRVGGTASLWTVPVERDVAGRGSVLLHLLAGVEQVPAAWRATTWNAFGESAPSQQTIVR